MPDLLHRVEEGSDSHWTPVNLLFLSSQLAYRKGDYEEALRSLNAWIRSKDERPINAVRLYYARASALPDFWRAMILARLDQAEGARKAYGDGAQKLRAGFPPDEGMIEAVITFYASHALQQEAREVLRSQGIAVPDTEEKP